MKLVIDWWALCLSFSPCFLYLRYVFPHLSSGREEWPQDHDHWALSSLLDGHSKSTSHLHEGRGGRQEKKDGGCEKKINRFPLSGWAVSLACQWSHYTPRALDRHWQEESMLTVRRNKSEHRFALQEREGPSHAKGPCSGGTKEHGMRRQWALDQGFFGVGSWMWSGFHTLPLLLSCLTVLLLSTNAFIPASIIYLWIHQRKPRCTDCGGEKFITFTVGHSLLFSPFSLAFSFFFFPPWLPISCLQPTLKKPWWSNMHVRVV